VDDEIDLVAIGNYGNKKGELNELSSPFCYLLQCLTENFNTLDFESN
jgi:hypothetical protein